METADDAGVYRLSESCALVQTADIITPVVDDPFTFGRIAAANALSDVYAMGGQPLTALNLLFFPACSLPEEMLSDILAGGQSALEEAGCQLVGGHTVEDDELKYGLSVTGVIHPDRIVRNGTARVGDSLLLTKPLGTGIVATALKADMAPDSLAREAAAWMGSLNRAAAELMMHFAVSAATDVTGFGCAGHALEMAGAAGVSFRLRLSAIPVMSGIEDLIALGLVPAGCYRNRDHYSPRVASRLPADLLLPLFDPQTSGGLLIALPKEDAARFLRQAESTGLFAVEIGDVIPQGGAGLVIV